MEILDNSRGPGADFKRTMAILSLSLDLIRIAEILDEFSTRPWSGLQSGPGAPRSKYSSHVTWLMSFHRTFPSISTYSLEPPWPDCGIFPFPAAKVPNKMQMASGRMQLEGSMFGRKHGPRAEFPLENGMARNGRGQQCIHAAASGLLRSPQLAVQSIQLSLKWNVRGHCSGEHKNNKKKTGERGEQLTGTEAKVHVTCWTISFLFLSSTKGIIRKWGHERGVWWSSGSHSRK